MTNFPVLFENVMVDPLLTALEMNPDLWSSLEGRRGKNGPHREAPDIWVRYNDYSKIHDISHFNDEHFSVWYPAFEKLPELKSIIFNLMSWVQGEVLGGVLITKVPAGKKIYPHVDEGWHVNYYDKFYVQLSGADACTFCCNDNGNIESFSPKKGEVYLFDNRKEHWVINDSNIDRITLIVCIRTKMFGRV